MQSNLESLSRLSGVVADTGDIKALQAFQAKDATTNPSLILQAAKMEEYAHLIGDAVSWAQAQGGDGWVEHALDKIYTNFGAELLKQVSGVVSTEVDPSLSFDTGRTIAKARRLIALYEAQGIGRDRVLIKIAATWEGIAAARQLETEGIRCNLTLIFSLAQAVACAEAGVHLISPFVGRILDWYRKSTGLEYVAAEDPGVRSVKSIYAYFKQHGYSTIVMAASFRNIGEIIELAGCDKLTISPALLGELADRPGELTEKIREGVESVSTRAIQVDEANFRWLMNEDAMATEKLSEGIRKFHADTEELREYVKRSQPR